MSGARTTTVRVIAVVVALALGAALGIGARRVLDDDDGGTKTKTRPAAGAQRGPTALPPGRYTSKRFLPVRSVMLTSGWRLDIDSRDLLEVSRAGTPRGSIGFGRPNEVFDDRFLPDAEAIGDRAKVRPLPDDLAAYFSSIPDVQVFPSSATKLDGVDATTFAVALRPLPAENRHFCGVSRCMFWGRRGTQLFALFENDVTAFTVLRVKGETIVVAAAAPFQGGETFVPLVNEALRTVTLRRG